MGKALFHYLFKVILILLKLFSALLYHLSVNLNQFFMRLSIHKFWILLHSFPLWLRNRSFFNLSRRNFRLEGYMVRSQLSNKVVMAVSMVGEKDWSSVWVVQLHNWLITVWVDVDWPCVDFTDCLDFNIVAPSSVSLFEFNVGFKVASDVLMKVSFVCDNVVTNFSPNEKMVVFSPINIEGDCSK